MTFASSEAIAARTLGELRASSFTENRGQLHHPGIRFYAAWRNFQVGFADGAVLLTIVETAPAPSRDDQRPTIHAAQPFPEPTLLRGVMLRLRFDGANEVTPRARDPLSHPSHFFLGSDRARWQTDVRSYGEVVYEDLYDGVDLAYRATPAGVKYEFRLRAGANPGAITLVYEGADGVELDEAGNARIYTPLGDLTDSTPVSYQGADPVSCAFRIRGPRSYGLLCQGVDGSRPLVVDPLLTATFLGGVGTEGGNAIAVDMDRNAYVTGETGSVDFPATPGAFNQTLSGGIDAFVAKLDRTLSSRIYTTYLGGVGEDRGLSIAVDAGGTAYVTGSTNSTDFPVTPSAFNKTFAGVTDAFVVKLNATGTGLLYATYLGGSGEDRGHSVAVGSGGSVFVAGNTSSADFPVTALASDTVLDGVSDAFVAMLNVTGGPLDYATYLGGTGNDSALSIAVDSGGNAYVTGKVDSADFPVTAGAYNETFGGGLWDAFVAKVDPAGTSLLYATYLGGSGWVGEGDWGTSIAVDSGGKAYVTGQTDSYDFPNTTNALDPTFNGQGDVFVAKLNASGDSLVYATFLGGSAWDLGTSIAVDSRGNAYVTGETNSDGFPTTFDAVNGSKIGAHDGFVARLVPDGTSLNYSTFLGGIDVDSVKSIALDSAGNAYVTGDTDSPDFPATAGTWDTDWNWTDAFVAKFVWPSPDLRVVSADIAFIPPLAVNAGENLAIEVTVHNEGDEPASEARVRFHDGPPAGGNQIGTDQTIPDIAPFGGTGRASVRWTAWPPGPQDICVVADPDDSIGELSESDNQACATIQVIYGPITSLLIGQPNYTAAETYIRSVTPLAMSVLDRGGTGINFTRYRIDMGSWIDYTGPFTVPGEREHLLEWFSEDNTGTQEAAHVFRLRVDERPPTSSFSIGDPKYVAASTFVTSASAFTLTATDGGATPVGVARIEYRIDGGAWIPYGAPFPLVGEGMHSVDYRSSDRLGNSEAPQTLVVVVDDIPPATALTVGEPKSLVGGTFVNASTPIRLTTADGGVTPVGAGSTAFRVWSGTWSAWALYLSPFTLTGEDGVRFVEYRSADRLGTQEAVRNETLVLDGTPPTTTISPAKGPYTTATTFTFSAADAGSGVARIEYRVDAGPWLPYEVGFSLPAGDHIVSYRAADRVNNMAAVREFSATIVATAGPLPQVIWTVLAVTTGVVALLSFFEFLRRSFWTSFVFLWARLHRSDILDNKKRGMVVGYLAANPAANFAAIRADLGMAIGTLTYHLWVLEKEGEIKSWRDGRFRRYAPSGHRVAEMQPRLTDIELLLLKRIHEAPGLTQKELAKDVGVSQPAISYHISRMAQMGVVAVERRGRANRYTANLGDVPGDAGPQVDRGDILDFEPPDDPDDSGAPR